MKFVGGDSGECVAGDHRILRSGPTDGSDRRGVILARFRETRRCLVSWRPVSDRLLSVRLNHRHGKFSRVVGYAPTNVATDEEKDRFFSELRTRIAAFPRHYLSMVLLDANASSSRKVYLPRITGNSFVDTTTNDNGDRLLDLYSLSDHLVS